MLKYCRSKVRLLTDDTAKAVSLVNTFDLFCLVSCSFICRSTAVLDPGRNPEGPLKSQALCKSFHFQEQQFVFYGEECMYMYILQAGTSDSIIVQL